MQLSKPYAVALTGLLLAGLCGGCATQDRMIDRRLWAKLSSSQLFYFEGEAKPVTLHFSMTNNSGDLLDPPIETSYLLINDVKWPESNRLMWPDGGGDVLWERLPAHCCLFFRRTIGGEMFSKPGRYTIAWHGDTFEATPVRIVVRPHPRP